MKSEKFATAVKTNNPNGSKKGRVVRLTTLPLHNIIYT